MTEPTDVPIAVHPYELPSARRVVSYGLLLAYRATAELRRASIYIGLLTLALLGPPLVFAIEFIAHFDISDPEVFSQVFGGTPDPSAVGPLLLLLVIIYPAIAGWIAVSVDAQLIAVALLAARAGERPFTLREATIRARQCFWRAVRGSFVVGLLNLVLQLVLGTAFAAIFSRGTASGFVVSVIGVILLAPLGYLATGIVLGDVGAVESLKRSTRLARARPRIALVVALFTIVTAAIQLFALFAGVDLFVRLAEFVHVGLEGGALPLTAVILGVLLLVVAFGSLSFTVAAIVAAPQVAAFMGLTFYTAGLDRARDLPPASPRFRWVTRPMAALIVLVFLGSIAGVTQLNAGPSRPLATLTSLVRQAATGHAEVSVEGARETYADDQADETGPVVESADIVAAGVAYLASVPAWLLGGTFACGQVTVACSSPGPNGEFDAGAYLVFERVAGPPETRPTTQDWGPVFKLRGSEGAPGDEPHPIAGASDAFLTTWTNAVRSIHQYTFRAGSFVELGTTARSAWIGDSLLTLIPFRTGIRNLPDAWNVWAATGDPAVVADRTTDSIGRVPNDGLFRFFQPATIAFDPAGL